jgi:pimeloyl-ACP methyl ester carboxylesterase
MHREDEVSALDLPVLVIAGDADVVTLEHSVALFRFLGGGGMGDMGQPLPDARLAIMPKTSHTAVINQPDLLRRFIEPFLQGETPEACGTDRPSAPVHPAKRSANQ